MTITGYLVMQNTETRNEKTYKTAVITDGSTVDVCRTSDPTTMNELGNFTRGEMITLCITQNVYKDKVYNTITKIVYEP